MAACEPGTLQPHARSTALQQVLAIRRRAASHVLCDLLEEDSCFATRSSLDDELLVVHRQGQLPVGGAGVA